MTQYQDLQTQTGVWLSDLGLCACDWKVLTLAGYSHILWGFRQGSQAPEMLQGHQINGLTPVFGRQALHTTVYTVYVSKKSIVGNVRRNVSIYFCKWQIKKYHLTHWASSHLNLGFDKKNLCEQFCVPSMHEISNTAPCIQTVFLCKHTIHFCIGRFDSVPQFDCFGSFNFPRRIPIMCHYSRESTKLLIKYLFRSRTHKNAGIQISEI